MIHPLDAASNTYFFVSVSKSKLEKKRLALLIATAGVAPSMRRPV